MSTVEKLIADFTREGSPLVQGMMEQDGLDATGEILTLLDPLNNSKAMICLACAMGVILAEVASGTTIGEAQGEFTSTEDRLRLANAISMVVTRDAMTPKVN
jgi:hypothetical protein